MRYWLYVNNEIRGPYEVEKLAALENFSGASLVSPEYRPEGEAGDWKAASVYPEVMAALSPSSASAARPAGKAGGRAVLSLVLGVASYLLGLTFLTGIPAWILGRKELKAIEAGLAPAEGKRLAKIGMWLGILSTILPLLLISAFLFFLSIAKSH